MKLILGLGNPGGKYQGTRHNLGFAAVDGLALAAGIKMSRLKYESLIGQGVWEQETIVLAKPLTYMNNSGIAAKALLAAFNLSPEQLIVICDDLDLEPGVLRLRPRGGSGGHRGLASIIQRLNTDDFIRLRLGVGRPPGYLEPAEYVLSRPNPSEYVTVDNMLSRAIDAILILIEQGIAAAMNKVNPKDK